MSKHNYSQYSNKKKNHDGKTGAVDSKSVTIAKANHDDKSVVTTTTESMAAIPAPQIKMEVVPTAPTAPIELVHETVDTVPVPKTVEGVVANCAKLNVRVAPDIDAEVVCVLDAMSEIKIDVAESTRDWFKIYTAIGGEGYCMRKFVDAHL